MRPKSPSCLVERHAHALPHARKGSEHTGIAGPSGDEYHDGMVEHDMHVGELLKLLDDLGIAENTIVLYSTDNGPHYNTWPDAGNTPFRSEKNSNWEGAYRVPASSAGRASSPRAKPSTASWPTKTGCRPSLPPPAAPDIKEKLKAGVELNGRKYKNYIDGYNMLDYLRPASRRCRPRKEFIYVDDGGAVAAIRVGDWKAVYLENRAHRLQIWK
jgi:arylsulfatase A-like enzyme